MSLVATDWVFDHAPDVPPEAVATLLGLARHADSAGRGAYPSQATLSRYARKTDRQIRRNLGQLEALGLIRRGDQGLVSHLPATKRPVVWDLAIEMGIARVTADPDRTSTTGRERPAGRVRPVTGAHPDAHDRSREAPRPDADVRQTVLEPKTPPPSVTTPPSAALDEASPEGEGRPRASNRDQFEPVDPHHEEAVALVRRFDFGRELGVTEKREAVELLTGRLQQGWTPEQLFRTLNRPLDGARNPFRVWRSWVKDLEAAPPAPTPRAAARAPSLPECAGCRAPIRGVLAPDGLCAGCREEEDEYELAQSELKGRPTDDVRAARAQASGEGLTDPRAVDIYAADVLRRWDDRDRVVQFGDPDDGKVSV